MVYCNGMLPVVLRGWGPCLRARRLPCCFPPVSCPFRRGQLQGACGGTRSPQVGQGCCEECQDLFPCQKSMADRSGNQFAGRSSLREPEKKVVRKDPVLQAYLSKYADGPERQAEYKEPKKKKKKIKTASAQAAVQIVDNDVSGFARGTSPLRRRMLEGSDEEDEGERGCRMGRDPVSLLTPSACSPRFLACCRGTPGRQPRGGRGVPRAVRTGAPGLAARCGSCHPLPAAIQGAPTKSLSPGSAAPSS
jgi:hypothetical protein